jgi:hypothetical protein
MIDDIDRADYIAALSSNNTEHEHGCLLEGMLCIVTNATDPCRALHL